VNAPNANRARIYIDGEAGTTGLLLRQHLEPRSDLELLKIDPNLRKDPRARADVIAHADVAVLCLPDEAAVEAVELAAKTDVRLLDASSAHRVSEGWTYGLAELSSDQRAAIRKARAVSNPGCYPTGVILLLRPLVEARLLSPEAPIAVHALSGYSGGGKKMIEHWESQATELSHLPFEAPYALERAHKHLPEMARYSGLSRPPLFVPAVGPFRQGMRVEIPLHQSLLGPGLTRGDIHDVLSRRYATEPFIHVRRLGEGLEEEQGLDPRRFNGTNGIELIVAGNPLGHVLLIAILDNLGKGAAGAAVQNLNLMLGLDEKLGLSSEPTAFS
jgi:N-acetyl-gamma-glutamyl-phosphate reductase